ncbi:MAG: multidrug transporter, partial [Paracoccaceae bacterium]
DRLLTTYRDAIIFCVGYPTLIWGILMGLNASILRIFSVDAEGAEIIWAFTHVGAGAFVFTGMMFVANAAFNNLGRPVYSTLINWIREGVISLPLALWFASLYGASGVVYAQAVVAVLIGVPVTFWGLRYIQRTAKISSALGNARAANF